VGRPGGLAIVRGNRGLLGLVALTFGYFALFGPVPVALALHVTDDLHGPATLLGLYWGVFGVGAVIGGVLAGRLRRAPLRRTTIGVVIGFGVALLPLGLGAPTGIELAALACAGLIWAPYPVTSTALIQRGAPPGGLTAVLAVNGAVAVTAVPLGTLLGGPLVALAGPRTTLLTCAVGTIGFGCAAAVLAWSRTRHARGPV